MKIHHLGIATNNLEKVTKFIKDTHNVISQKGPIWDKNLKANLILFEVREGLAIELVCGPIVESLVRKKINLYHFCYEVNDLKIFINKFISNGATLIKRPTPAKLFDGRKVAFLITPCGIIELLEN